MELQPWRKKKKSVVGPLKAFFFFFFSNSIRKRVYKRGSLPLLIRKNERIDDHLRMLPKTRVEAAHLAKECALKLALRETFKAFQL
jgi:hypothetical protein